MGSSASCGPCLLPLVVMGQFGATSGWSWVRPGVCQSCSSAKLQDASPALSPEKLSWLGRACSLTSCLPSAHFWGHIQCVWLASPLTGQEVLWSAAGPYRVNVHGASLGVLLLMGSCFGGGRCNPRPQVWEAQC